MQIDHNGGLFKDKQLIKMQEVPDQVPQGETPQAVCMYAHEELFDAVKPGDKVEVTGIYKAIPVRINRKTSTVRDVFRTFIEVIHYRKQVDGRYTVEGEEMEEVAVCRSSHVEPPYRRGEGAGEGAAAGALPRSCHLREADCLYCAFNLVGETV